MKNLEIACFNYESALIAEQGGANRIELCSSYSVGGLTPEMATLKKTLSKVNIDVFVMIRPRAGNFVYTQLEFEQMKATIKSFKSLGISGFVFGILDKASEVNMEQNKELVQLANPLPCSFHRAYDRTTNSLIALEQIINCGFKAILTSGSKATAIEGISELKILVEKSKNRITIMPGGGVRSSNIKLLAEQLNSNWFHSSAISDHSQFANLQEVIDLKEGLGSTQNPQ